MHFPISPSERAALRLAAMLAGYPDESVFVRDVVMQAVHAAFDEDILLLPVERPVRGRDILVMHSDD